MPLTHILFDFFGTLVEYSASRVEQGYECSHSVLTAAGSALGYDEFLALWERTNGEFDACAEATLEEFSMDAVCTEFLRRAVPAPPSSKSVATFRDVYLREWNKGVRYIAGVVEMLADLSRHYTLALVTNTHQADFVHGHLEAMGCAPYFDTVVTSIEHGRRKPSPCIFARALELGRGRPESALHVGDSYSADYLGAAAAGVRCLLLDPLGAHDVPASDRLGEILELRGLIPSGRSGAGTK